MFYAFQYVGADCVSQDFIWKVDWDNLKLS